jgi:hypothetical protein
MMSFVFNILIILAEIYWHPCQTSNAIAKYSKNEDFTKEYAMKVRNNQQTINPCDIYGQIYIEKDRRRANYLVYVEPNNDYRANLLVYKESSPLNADKEGLWYFVEQRGFADYTICFVEDRSIADFIIYYTDKFHQAGCR